MYEVYKITVGHVFSLWPRRAAGLRWNHGNRIIILADLLGALTTLEIQTLCKTS